MRFIQKWSYSCAKSLALALGDNHQKRFVYYYGFEIAIGAMVKGALMITAALLLGILIPALIISFVFASLRVLAGGYHMDTYGKCILVSIAMFITAGLIAQYTFMQWSLIYIMVLIAVTFISGLYVLIRYAPKDTPNKPITDPKEIKKFKRLSIIYLFVCLIVSSAFSVFGLNIYALSLCFGVLLEIFGITPTGHKFFDIIKYGFDRKNSKNPKLSC